MFRRPTTAPTASTATIAKQAPDLGVKFCDGCGISTRAERTARRVEAARTKAAMTMAR